MIPTKPTTEAQRIRSVAERIESACRAVVAGSTHPETVTLARRKKPGGDDPAWHEFQAQSKAPLPARQTSPT